MALTEGADGHLPTSFLIPRPAPALPGLRVI
jgi:hypothetical protein